MFRIKPEITTQRVNVSRNVGVYVFVYLFGFLKKEIRTEENLNFEIHVKYENRNWSQAVHAVGETLLGTKVFGECSPETCNASLVADRIVLKGGSHTFWIKGFIRWSPAIKYKGCFRSKTDIQHWTFTSSANSVLECSNSCGCLKEKGYLFLHKETCKCIGNDLYKSYKEVILQESTSICNISCPGNVNYKCGGIGHPDMVSYSVYEVVQSFNKVSRVGQHCASINSSNEDDLKYQDCREHMQFICEKYNPSKSGDNFTYTCCSNGSSWYNAHRECQRKNETLYSEFKIQQVSCLNANRRYWSGNHIEEKIVWGNDDLPIAGNFRCLSLTIYRSKSEYELYGENCSKELNSLYYKSDLSTEKHGNTILPNTIFPTATSEHNTDSNTGTQMANYKNIHMASIAAGSVGGVVFVILIIIIITVIKRRRNNSPTAHNKTSTIPKDSYYYSKPHIRNGTIEDRHELVNNTEDGVYNHLGDNLITIKPTETVYNVTGRHDNEYDVSNASGQRNGLKATGAIYNIMDHDENEYNVSDASGLRTHTNEKNSLYDLSCNVGDGE